MAGCSTGIGYIEVRAANGKPSLLFDALLQHYGGNIDRAYRDYLRGESKEIQTRLEGAPRDINGEVSAGELLNILTPTVKRSKNYSFLTDALKEEEARIEAPGRTAEGDQEGFYKLFDKAGTFIKNLMRTNAMIYEMAYGSKLEGGKGTLQASAEKSADDAFFGVDKASGQVKLDGIQYTYPELVEHFKKKFAGGANRGTMIHLKIEEYIAIALKDKSRELEAQRKIQELADTEGMNPAYYDWVVDEANGIWDRISDTIGIRAGGPHPTKVYSELRVFDEDMEMGSTIDIIVEDPLTGKIRVVDVKTGVRFLDQETHNTMVYGRMLTPIYNTSKNRARLQVMLNSMAIKASHPNAQFEVPLVAWIPSEEEAHGGKRVYDMDVRDYLSMIERYYKYERPDVYKKLLAKSPNIFNPAHYGGTVNTSFTQDLINDTQGSRADEKLVKLKAELERLELYIQLRPDGNKYGKGKPTPAEMEKREELILKIQQAESSFPLPLNINNMHEYEIGLAVKYFGVLSDTNNPYLMSYSQTLSKAHESYNKERSKIEREFNILLQKAVTKVYGDRTGAGKAFTSIDKAKLWDQLVDKTEIDMPDGTKRLSVGMKLETSPGYNTLPAELKDLSVFMRTNMKEVFNHVMVDGPGAVVVNKPGEVITKLDIYNKDNKKDFQYDETFIPKMSITSAEIHQRFKDSGLLQGSLEMAKYYYAKYATEWFEDNVEGHNQENYGIPVRYVGTTSSITAVDTHSLDLERSFKKYMEAMLTKKHYDTTYAIGTALSGYMRDSSPNAKHSADFLEHAVYRNILKRGSAQDDKIWTHGVTFGRYKGQDLKISTRKILQGLSHGVASIGLWLNFPSMVKNAAQAEWAVNKEAITYGFMEDKWGNMEPTDLTYKNFLKAKIKVANMQKDFIAGKGRSNPIHTFMKEFDLYPQIKDEAYDLVTGGNKAYSTDHLTIGYQHAEDMTTANLMVTAMMSMKIKSGPYKGQSMWDVYERSHVVDPQTGFGTFKLPDDFTRGKLRMGDGALEELNGLHPFEIQRMKSMTRKLKGGYRKEERSMIEASYLGEAFMLFRRWLPANVVNTMKGQHMDITVGAMELVEQRNGEDIYEWKARVVEGRLVTMFKMFTTAIGLSNTHKWADMSMEQRRNMVDLGFSFMTWTTIAMLAKSLLGDDEDKEAYKFVMELDSRIVEHANIIGTGEALTEQPAIVKTIAGLIKGVSQLLYGSTEYVLTGDESALFTQKGDIRGLRQIERNIMFGGARTSVERFIED